MTETLAGKTQKVAELPTGRKFSVLGFRAKQDKARVVLQYGDSPPVAVWATKGLRKILVECLRSFRSSEKDNLGRKLFWLVACSGVQKLCELAIGIEPAKTFQNSEGETIVWNPIKVLSAPETGRLEILQAIGKKCEEYETLCAESSKNTGLQKIKAPENKATKKTTDLPEGE